MLPCSCRADARFPAARAAFTFSRMDADARDYRLLAIDLDGTLLDARGRLPEVNRAALHRAHEAGLRLVLCTGRSLTETRGVLDQIGLDLDASVTAGGAIVTDLATGRTIERTAFAPELALEATAWLRQRGHTVLWLLDADEAGFDGYVVAGRQRHPAIDQWLAKSPVRMRPADDAPAATPAPVRVTIIDEIGTLEALGAEFGRAFAGRANYNVICVRSYGFTVIEAFAHPVDKWLGIAHLCRRWGIDPRQTAAIGDDVNDIPMLRRAGLGVAVANAGEDVRRHARLQVGSNVEGGVAELIEWLLGGPA